MILLSILKNFFKFLILPLIVIFTIFYLGTIPNYSGVIQHGRSDIGEVIIQREDPFGIPHIKGKTMRDCLYGLGYAQAQDRLFAMHVKRRAAQGRLSEFGGEQTIETDIFFRTIGISKSIQKIVDNMNSDTKHLLQSFSDGINDYVDSLPFLPLEFQLIGDKFDKWTLKDSLSIELLINAFLSLDFYFEPFKQLVKEKYGEDMAARVFAMSEQHLFEKTYTLNDDDLKQSNIYEDFQKFKKLHEHDFDEHFMSEVQKTHLIDSFVKMTQIEMIENNFIQLKGSNAWVVDGTQTKSGKPLLANDPHLELNIPSFWYQTELLFEVNGEKKYVIGASVPGMPALVLGKTEYAGWGITNNMADSTDLYIETIKGNKYLHDGNWIEMREREEIIKIGQKGDQKVLKVYETHHGPVLRSMLDLIDYENPFEFEHQYSLSWPGTMANSNIFVANQHLILASNITEMRDSLRMMTGPVLNNIYATSDGHIGFMSCGRIPVRNNPSNAYPQDGTNQENDWLGFYKDEQQPQVIDPKKHYLINANNKVATDNIVHHITATSTTHGRSYRIDQIIQEGIKQNKKFDSQDFMKMQQDRVDSYCQETHQDLLNIFQKYQKQFFVDEQSQAKITKIYDILKDWDCEMASSSAPAAVYGVWEQFLLVKFFNRLSDDQYRNNRVAMNLMFDHFFFKNIQSWAKGQNTQSEYCVTDSNENLKENNCIYNVFQSFIQAYDMLEKQQGYNINQWRWGLINSHEYMHAPFSKTPLQPLFGRKKEGGGNRRTINVGGVNLGYDIWRSIYSPNYRMVLDFDPNGKSYYAVDTGVSENIFSPHYDDQLDMFIKGEYIEMKYGYENFGNYGKTLKIVKSIKDSEL